GICQPELEVFLFWRYQTAPAPPAARIPMPAAATAAAVPAAATRAPPTMTFGRCRRACRRAYTVAVAVETISSASSICRSIHFDLKTRLDLSMRRAYLARTRARLATNEVSAFSESFLRVQHASEWSGLPSAQEPGQPVRRARAAPRQRRPIGLHRQPRRTPSAIHRYGPHGSAVLAGRLACQRSRERSSNRARIK